MTATSRPIPLAQSAEALPLSLAETAHTDLATEYEATVTIPDALQNRRLLLRADRVGVEAELFIDGVAIARHFGTFTQWDVLLPDSLGTQFTLRAVLKAPRQQVNPYDKVAILGGFTLYALPAVYATALSAAVTQLSEGYALVLQFEANGAYTRATAEIATEAGSVIARGDAAGDKVLLPCIGVTTWTPDTPVVYQGRLRLIAQDGSVSVIPFPVGFWQARVTGRQVLLDGNAVRLRGLNYREPFAFEGRSIETELQAFKAANVNFLRALYYPFSRQTLALCSKLGFYVEQTLPFWGVGIDGEPVQNLPHLEETFVNLCRETLAEGLQEPCVLLWSLGGESCWGSNFRACYHAVRAADTRRLIDFHYPMTIPQDEMMLDVFSVSDVDYRLPADACYDHMVIGHTQGADNAIGYATARAGYPLPVLHVSYAHIPCYNRDELQADPGLHEFWGRSLSLCYQNLCAADACLGGAVMAAVDENGLFDRRLRGMERGVLNGRGEPKPEYYHLQMVYGQKPVRTKPTPCLALPALKPDPLTVEETDAQILVQNRYYHVLVSKQDALLSGVWVGDRMVIAKGPFLQSTRYLLGPWKGEAADCRALPNGGAALTLTGSYGDAAAIRFTLTFAPDGRVDCAYEALRLGREMPHTVKAGIGLDPGGLNELGLAFVMPAADTFRWHRNGLWNEYPAGHIGRNIGETPWNGSPDALSMKHEIIGAAVQYEGGSGIGIVSAGEHSVRLQPQPREACLVDDRDARIDYTGTWYFVDDNCGYFGDTLAMSREAGAAMTLRFTGNEITLYGSLHILHGLYRVELDHKTVAENCSACPLPVDFASFSRGYEKRFHQPLYHAQNLPDGEHTVTLRVLGQKEPSAQDCYVPFDYAVIGNDSRPPQTRLMINNAYNYARLVHGNFMQPRVCLEVGKQYRCTLQLLGKADEQA